jgi:hypothetical protein
MASNNCIIELKNSICVLKVTTKRVQDRSIISSNLITDSLLICVFCTSCEAEIVQSVLQIKTKSILRFHLYKTHRSKKN